MTTPTPPAVSEAMREAVARVAEENLTGIAPGWLRQLVAALCDGPIASEIARLTGERDAARETNRELHRRLQAAEGPLQSRIAHLNQGVKFWREQRIRQGARAVAAICRAEAAEAETARLRAALEEIAKGAPETEPHPWDGELDTVCWNTAQIARAALTSQEKPDV